MGIAEVYARAIEGVVDLRMAADAGMAPGTMRRRAAAEGWRRLHPGVWALPTHRVSATTRLIAAQRRLGPEAVADRHTALAVAGVTGRLPTRPQLLLPHALRVPTIEGVEVRRSRHLVAEDLTRVGRVASVTVARALLDLARDLRTAPLRSLALAAVRSGHLVVEDLAATMDRHPHAPGRRRALQVLHDVDRDGSDSGLEFRARSRILDAGLRPDADQPTITVGGRRRRIDVAWLVLRVGVECHGYRFHTGAPALDRDTQRMNDLVADGDWVILQVTETTLRGGWDGFVAGLRRCLRRRADDLGIAPPPGC